MSQGGVRTNQTFRIEGRQIEVGLKSYKLDNCLSFKNKRSVYSSFASRACGLGTDLTRAPPSLPIRVRVLRQEPVIDPLAVALAEGLPYAEAGRLANAAAALTTTKLGAQAALPTCREVNRLLQK